MDPIIVAAFISAGSIIVVAIISAIALIFVPPLFSSPAALTFAKGSAIAGVIVTIITFIFIGLNSQPLSPSISPTATISGDVRPTENPVSASDISDMQTTIAELNDTVDSLQAKVDALIEIPPDVSLNSELVKIQGELNQLDNNFQTLDNDLEEIRQSILDDPLKAVSLPLINKDLETLEEGLSSLQTETRSNTQSLQQRIDQNLESNRSTDRVLSQISLGVAGTLVAVAGTLVTVVSIGVTIVLRGRAKKDTPETKTDDTPEDQQD